MRTRPVKVEPRDFLKLDLRAHTLLRGVPLHDVWAVDLPAGKEGATLADLRTLPRSGNRRPGGAATRFLFALRHVLGRLFRWGDRELSAEMPASSYAHRLSQDDIGRSLVAAGTADGPFRTLYAFDGESLSEVINATVHAFLCAALVPTEGGYRLYWGIYVKPVSRWTNAYMTLIAPFRRYVVYPSVLGELRRNWIKLHAVAG